MRTILEQQSMTIVIIIKIREELQSATMKILFKKEIIVMIHM